ncbi:MAG: YabP/YqfC family sporulation protein [Clostridia bacterium]|nr:YabP/YqfC family sporulation protein [Clostridia bacterium]
MEQKNLTTLVVENKNQTKITGVVEVLSATDKAAVIKLVDGNVQIFGAGLKVEKLSPEEKLLLLSGSVSKIEFLNELGGKGFFKRLFK